MVESLLELCCEVGIPEVLVMDGNGAQNNPEVRRVTNDYAICIHNSEPENQQQNLAERAGAMVKLGIRQLHFETRFEITYWCYVMINQRLLVCILGQCMVLASAHSIPSQSYFKPMVSNWR
jgi:hypothetical protein